MGRTVGYVRVSTQNQNEDRQLVAMHDMGVAQKNIYIDKMSGKDFERPMYKKMLRALKKDDVVYIKSNGVNEIIIATSTKQDDNLVADFCKKNRIPCVRGSEENVLERFAMVAKKHPAEIYIRATGDNPSCQIYVHHSRSSLRS